MKTFHKLALIALLPCMFLILLGYRSISALNTEHASITTIYKDRVVPLRDLKLISDAYAVSVIDAVNKLNEGLITVEKARADLQQARIDIDKLWHGYKATYLTPEEQRLVASVDRLLPAGNQEIERLIAQLAVLQGIAEGQLKAFDGELYAVIDPISEGLAKLINLQLAIVDEEYRRSETALSSTKLVTILITIASIIASMALGAIIARQLTRRMGGEPDEVALAAQRVANGYLELNLSTQPNPGSVMQAMLEMS